MQSPNQAFINAENQCHRAATHAGDNVGDADEKSLNDEF